MILSRGFGQMMIKFIPFTLLLAGCESMERMNANNAASRIQVAALQSQAVVGAEWARTQAAASVAQSQAMSEVATNAAWAAQLPWVVLALCLTVIAVAVIYWRGRVAVQLAGEYPQARILPPPAQVLPRPQYKAMQDFAQAHGGQIVWTNGTPIFQQSDGRRRQLRITTKTN